MKRSVVILSTLGVMVLAGCGNQTVSLSYAGADPQLSPGVAANGAKKIYLEPFGDKRPVKDDIGDLRNGYGMKLGDIVLTNDAGETATNAVKQELEQAGYQVVLTTPGAQPADAPVLTGDVVGLDCCPAVGFGAGIGSKISLDATMIDGGEEKLDSIYVGEGNKTAFFYFGQSDYQEAMSGALQSAVQQLIADVDAQVL